MTILILMAKLKLIKANLKMKKITLLVLCCTIVFLVLNISKKYQADELWAFSNLSSEQVKKLYSIINIIQKSYVDEVDGEEIFQDAVNGILSNLDPHSAYLAKQDYSKWAIEFEGFAGIGIRFAIVQDTIMVTSVMEDSPASEAGIKRGDKIISIDGKLAVGINQVQAANFLNGDNREHLALSINRIKSDTPRVINLDRDLLKIKSIPFAFFIQPGVAYVKLSRFSLTTDHELQRALDSLASNGMDKLILDLRGNGGGYFCTALSVADKFLDVGKLIVTTRGRDESSLQEYFTTNNHKYLNLPLIVLVDHGTASSSEIVAAALQDWDRALIIGETTFGKGLVQSQYAMRDGSALLITTARYFSPCGRSIQRKYKEFSKDEYYQQGYVADDASSTLLTTRPGFRTPAGRTVLGGGGIIPDIAISSNEVLSDSLRQLIYDENNYIFTFANKYLNSEGDLFKNVDTFIEKFVVKKKMFQQFQGLVKNSDVSYSYYPFDKFEKEIQFFIKREIAYLRWGKEARFRVHLNEDRQCSDCLVHFEKAIHLLAISRDSDNRKTLKN